MISRIRFALTLLLLCSFNPGTFSNPANSDVTAAGLVIPVSSCDTVIRKKTPNYNPQNPLVTIPCESANVACTGNIYTFPSGTTGNAPPSINGYPYYGCVGLTIGPAWYYMQIGVAGDIILTITQVGPAPVYQPHDVDFVCWGPFASVTDGCATGLTGANIVDCSFSPSATETCHILNAQVGEIYILLMTNFSMQPGTMTFSQTSGSGQTNCNPVVHCSMIAITANPASCNPGTNTFSVSGNMEFTNPPSTGTLTITDNTAVPPVSQSFNPTFTSPKAYNLTNIPCDGLTHYITAVFSDSTACTLTQQFTSPGAICPTGIISGGGAICNDGLSQADVSINISGSSAPYTFTYAINGINQPPVSNYSGSLPYHINTNVPGLYNLVSLTNPACPAGGSVSGSATVTVNPLPVATISGTTSVCQNSAVPLITFTGANATAPYTFTYSLNGGANQFITTTSGNSVTLPTPTNAAGILTYTFLSVQDASPTACSQPQTGSATVTVNPLPTAGISGTTTVCQNATSPLITFTGASAVAPYTFTYNINGGAIQSVTTTSGNTSTIAAPTNGTGTFTYTLLSVQDGSSTTCTQLQTGSAAITIIPAPYVSLTACNDPKTTTTSRSFILKGGVPPGGQYYIDGLPAPGGWFNPMAIPAGIHQLTYSYTGLNTCVSTSSSVPIIVITGSAPGSCPQNFTDPRDNQTYRAYNLGSYCWMLTDLNYGTKMTFSPEHQSDNCIPEKYCLPTDANCTINGGLYQWDELLQYQVPGPGLSVQGLCPPEWHVPTQAEWQDLINAVASRTPGDGIAGGFLKDSIPTFGFHALVNGIFYLNNTWAFISGNPTVTMFWTSTTNGMYRAVARGMNIDNYSVSFYPSLRANAFPVRCVKD
ncbi:MAG: hypothetical protein NTY96_09125 [Bacteroidetes bacterium]|nr:hypothetical protein [Bacteroidota bacterium]